MSVDNVTEGKDCYATGDAETQAWFESQWKIWPTRSHQERTTNVAFHYGGVLAFREARGFDPEMSRDFRSHVDWHDRSEQ
jgi:hypothetical protein